MVKFSTTLKKVKQVQFYGFS